MYNTGEGFFKSISAFHPEDFKSEKKKKIFSKPIKDAPLTLVD